MSKLFDPSRHEPLAGQVWSESAARNAVTRIAAAACEAFDPALGWVPHPRDDGQATGQPQHHVYGGTGGAIWALRHLADVGAIKASLDFAPFVDGIAERHLTDLGQPPHGTASFLIGESGLRLLEWKFQAREDTADRLHACVSGNLRNPVREQLWGSSGTVLAAIAMAEWTGAPRWAELVQQAVQILWDEMEPAESAGGRMVWQQDLYGRQEILLGGGHGFVGNLFPAVRGAALLAPTQVHDFASRALDLLQATALRDNGDANWHPVIGSEERLQGKLPLVQDCHGAVGIINRLAGLTSEVSDSVAWDQLLLEAGELSWRAGPLSKGVAFCHGTAGSAYALLKLYRRTGQSHWLDRARALAMHGVQQTERDLLLHGQGRHTLWTGDLGLACVLWDCITGEPAFPTLDVF